MLSGYYETTELRKFYQLSKHFSPPIVDLRQGRLIDDHGDEDNAELRIAHRDPYDVSQRELEYYFDVWGFLKARDLLFYLYPILRFSTDRNDSLLFLDEFLATLDRRLPAVCVNVDGPQAGVLSAALTEVVPAIDRSEYLNIKNLIYEISMLTDR